MSLLICSTNELVRQRWRSTLSSRYDVIEAALPVDIEPAISRGKVDLILLHRAMVGLAVIEGVIRLPTIVLADVPDDREAVSLFRRGVLGYANTYMTPNRLLAAVQTVLAGQAWVGHSLMQKIIRGAAGPLLETAHPGTPIGALSEREWQIALLVGKGQSNLEIAAELDISERTVKAHIGSIFKKTKTGSRLQLALFVRDHLSGSSGT